MLPVSRRQSAGLLVPCNPAATAAESHALDAAGIRYHRMPDWRAVEERLLTAVARVQQRGAGHGQSGQPLLLGRQPRCGLRHGDHVRRAAAGAGPRSDRGGLAADRWRVAQHRRADKPDGTCARNVYHPSAREQGCRPDDGTVSHNVRCFTPIKETSQVGRALR